MSEHDVSRELIARALVKPPGPPPQDQEAWAIRAEVTLAYGMVKHLRRSLGQVRRRGYTSEFQQAMNGRIVLAEERWEQVRAKYGLDPRGKVKE